jgi:hypothetical protein
MLDNKRKPSWLAGSVTRIVLKKLIKFWQKNLLYFFTAFQKYIGKMTIIQINNSTIYPWVSYYCTNMAQRWKFSPSGHTAGVIARVMGRQYLICNAAFTLNWFQLGRCDLSRFSHCMHWHWNLIIEIEIAALKLKSHQLNYQLNWNCIIRAEIALSKLKSHHWNWNGIIKTEIVS